MNRNDIFELINRERDRQDAKWGANRQQDWLVWLTILMEEVGEVAQAILEHQGWKCVREELIQVIAVGVAWLEDHSNDSYRIE